MVKRLKCWKKTQDKKELITFEHVCRRYNGEMVQVKKAGNFDPPWRTVHHSGTKVVDEEQSTSKTKALEHAYKYMKKTDSCW